MATEAIRWALRRRTSRFEAACRQALRCFGLVTTVAGSSAIESRAFTLRPPTVHAEPDSLFPLNPIDTMRTTVSIERRAVPLPSGSGSQAGLPARFVDDGAWCWFGDPRAVCVGGRTYVGWVTALGDIQVAGYDRGTRTIVTSTLHSRLEIDDHANPSILVLPDKRLMVFYSPHALNPMYYRVSTNPNDITSWGPVRTVPGDSRYTYPNPIQLSREHNKIYLFWRSATWKPVFSTSTDELNWSAPKTLLDAGNSNVPYIKYVSDGKGRIHFAFSESHPELLANNNIYYAYYHKDAFYRADGTFLRDTAHLPLVPSECDKVYDSNFGSAPGWIWDIALDAAGNPILAYAALPSITDHRYRYARWTGSSWEDREVAAAGGSIEASGADPYYSGGIVLDHADPSVAYLSRQVAPGAVHELERWITTDMGHSWAVERITSGSQQKNMRPVVPRNRTARDIGVLWMRGSYTSYTAYGTELMFAPGPTPTLARSGAGGQHAPPHSDSVVLGPETPAASSDPAGDGEIAMRVQGIAAGSQRIFYVLERPADVELNAYDVAGRLVRRLVAAPETAGSHTVSWDHPRPASGVYVLQLRAGSRVQNLKMVIVR